MITMSILGLGHSLLDDSKQVSEYTQVFEHHVQ